MTLTIALTPNEEARLTAVARQQGLDPAKTAHNLLTASLPPISEPENRGIHAEADDSEPKALSALASARHQFLASVPHTSLEADLPAVLLSEG